MSTGALDPIELPAAMPANTETVRRHRAVDAACRALDMIVALLALILLSPVLLVIAAAVRLESSGPSLFSQRRVGRSLESFTVYKFRTMRTGASHDRHREFVQSLIAGAQPDGVDGQPRFKLVADDRITRVGGFLRRSSLDELPQLWNVLRGDMSLVGPRPPIPYEVERYPTHWFRRFEVKPGITGLWQVSGRCELTMEQMIELDVDYVQRRSLHLNVWILLRTLPAVLSSRGAS
ncbi:MAG TPA: sugar transferase [Solirubrobacteraceae bacterium]|nr:sugar transferase [Solirubrobacteraceae bacterium]